MSLLMNYFDSSIPWLDLAIRVFVATLVGILIGIEREIANHPAGIKTHVLVCLGAAVTSMLALEMAHDIPQFAIGDARIDISRIASGVVSGIGFIGAGAIIKSRDGSVVTGITTAATVWISGCLGLVIGMGYFRVVLVSLLATLFATYMLKYIQGKFIKFRGTRFVEIILTDKSDTLPVIDDYFDHKQILVTSFDLTLAHGEKHEDDHTAKYCARYFLRVPRTIHFNEAMRDLAKIDNVIEAYESSSTSFSSKKKAQPQI